MNLPTALDFLMITIPTVLGCLLGAIGTFQAFMFKSISNLKEDLNRFKVQIASEHLTKKELRDLFKEQEAHITQIIDLKLNKVSERKP